MNARIVSLLLCIVFAFSCKQSSNSVDKYQNKRDDIINAKDKVKAIDAEELLLGSRLYLTPADKYLVIGDLNNMDKLFHVLDMEDFSYINSFGLKGQGPNEISRSGSASYNASSNEVLVPDFGKYKVFKYNIADFTETEEIKPIDQINIKKKQFPTNFLFVNDTLTVASVISPTGNSTFDQAIEWWNIKTGKFSAIAKEDEEMDRLRMAYDVSVADKLIVECHRNRDLLLIYDFDGKYIAKVHGPQWENKKYDKRISHFNSVLFCGDKIFASYSGDSRDTAHFGTKFIVFTKTGDYLKTIEIERTIMDFAYDELHNRIILSLDDEMQLGYLDLDDL